MTGLRQAPLGSGFDASTTAAEVIDGVDLTGQVAVVTGGHAGIGLETVRALSGAGAQVVVPARDPERARVRLKGIANVETVAMDLLDPRSIDDFTRSYRVSGRPLHLLVNNAGIMMVPLARDARGYESQLATNQLGPFQLTAGLWPALARAQGARVVNVSSWGHRHSSVIWNDPNYQRRPYDPLTAYGQSKTANNLFAVDIARRGADDGITAFSLHPGSIVTSVAEQLSTSDLQALGLVGDDGKPIIDPSRNMKSPEQGAATTVWCATSPLLHDRGGEYCENCDIAPVVTMSSDPTAAAAQQAEIKRFGSSTQGVFPYAVDPEAAVQLWDLCVDLTGVDIGD